MTANELRRLPSPLTFSDLLTSKSNFSNDFDEVDNMLDQHYFRLAL